MKVFSISLTDEEIDQLRAFNDTPEFSSNVIVCINGQITDALRMGNFHDPLDD